MRTLKPVNYASFFPTCPGRILTGICAKHAKEEFDKAIAALPAEEKAGQSAAVSAEFADEPKACAAGCVCTCGKKLDAE